MNAASAPAVLRALTAAKRFGRRYNRGGMVSPLAVLVSVAVAPTDVPLSAVPRETVTCPVCAHAFPAFALDASNAAGGTDRDFFARSDGPQSVFYLISTCPACLYSGYRRDFSAGTVVPPFVVERVLKAPRLPRPAGITPQSDPFDIRAEDRYALAITCYQWRQRSDESLAWLHLRASWVIRDTASVVPPTPRLERVVRYAQRWYDGSTRTKNPADADLRAATLASAALAEGRFNRYQEPFVRFFVAALLRRHGENLAAEPLLGALQADADLDEPLRRAAGRMLRSILEEQAHQKEAAACFERALLAEQIAPENRTAAMYLTGELCRRLGRARAAQRWLDRAIESGSLPEEWKAWARQQRSLVHDEGRE